jgi:uncharacterized membrane protein YhaH (DUF805 family)
MRGEILKAEDTEGFGLILGDDEKRYRFYNAQVRGDEAAAPGRRVDFAPLGDEARDIYLIPLMAAAPLPTAAAPAQLTPYAPPHAPIYLGTATLQPAQNPLSYFASTLTRNYARFSGRARRAEYWGYSLFWWIIAIVLFVIDAIIIAFTSNSENMGELGWVFFLTILWNIATLIPNIALVVRRLHDVGMSGWLYLIKIASLFLFWIPDLVIFVLIQLDSKPEINEHGPSPKYNHLEQTAQTFN